MAKVYRLSLYGYTIDVVPEYGMNCIKILHTESNTDILRTPSDVDVLANDDALLFGMPILFFPNRISNGRFIFENKCYTFPINEPKLNNFRHGDLHKLPFTVTDVTDDSITGIYSATETSPYLTFPHTFNITIQYKISLNGVEQSVTAENTSDSNMPFATAFHTAFNLSKGMKIKIPVYGEAERNMSTYLPTGKIIENFEEKTCLQKGEFELNGSTVSKLFKLNGNVVTLKLLNGCTVEYTIDEKYKYAMLYSPDGKETVCIEPQTYITDCLNLDVDPYEHGFDYIKPHQAKIFKSLIGVKKSPDYKNAY